MMTTNYSIPEYNHNQWRNYSHSIPNNRGRITNQRKHRPYNITEKDVGGHKVLYYVPSSYGSDYDLSQLDEEPLYEEQPKYYSPSGVRRRYYQSSDTDDGDYYIVPSRRDADVPLKGPQVIKRIYYDPIATSSPEYIYEDDYRPRSEEVIEYIVQDRTPRKRYVEEIQSVRPTIYARNLPSITRSTRSLSTSRSLRPHQINEFSSPRRSKMKQQSPRISFIDETPRKIIPQNKNPQTHISLKDIVAGNRARRGSRIPKPRREVDEQVLHDPPTYNKNFIKNGFLVHK